MNKEKELELREQYKDRGELTVNFILFAYDHYGDLLDFSDTYVVDQNTETVLDIKDYCRVKVVPRVFMLQPGTFCYNIIERAIDFVDRLREKRKDVTILPKESIYINNWTHMVFYCKKHNNKYTSKPNNIILGKVACKECNQENKSRSKKLTTLNILQDKLNKKYGENKYQVLIEESLNDSKLYKRKDRDKAIKKTNVHILCCECRNTFIYPIDVISKYISGEIKGLPCKNCEERINNEKRLQHFINKFTILNQSEKRNLDFDFSEAYLRSVIVGKYPTAKIFNIKCNKCGEHFDMLYGSLLNAVGCPHCSTRSSGELAVESWLKENNIQFNSQVNILNDEIVKLGNSRGFRIDFVVEEESNTYFIEYNGKQHYTYCDFFKKSLEGFYRQLKRDEYIKTYCANNGFVFIELPWTLSFLEIAEILNDVLIKKVPHRPYEYPNIKLEHEFDTGLHRGEFLKQNGLL